MAVIDGVFCLRMGTAVHKPEPRLVVTHEYSEIIGSVITLQTLQ